MGSRRWSCRGRRPANWGPGSCPGGRCGRSGTRRKKRLKALSANEGWKQLARSSGFAQLSTGCDYRQFLQQFVREGHANAAAVLAGVNAIAAGKSNSFTLSYQGLGPWQGRTLEIRINRLEIG